MTRVVKRIYPEPPKTDSIDTHYKEAVDMFVEGGLHS